MHHELVDGWLSWAVYTLAMRKTDGDVLASMRAAQRACAKLWNE